MTGYQIASAWVQLQPSFKGVQRTLDRELGGAAEKAATDAGKKASKAFTGSFDASGLKEFGAKAAIGFGVAAAAGYKLANAAGALDAAMAANVQVLGDASAAVQTWADDSVEAVGLSNRAALEAATGFAGLGKKIDLTGDDLAGFSTGMVQAAADMAAFKDVPVDQALADLQSGFAGSTEVLRKYNIFLDDASLKQRYATETGEEVTGVLTAQQRILATHAEILAQGTDMWGQWNRESDSVAARTSKAKAELENAAAALGEQLIPAASAAITFVGDLASTVAGLNDATGGAIVNIGAVSAGILGAAGAASYTAGKAAEMIGKFRTMSTAAQRTSLALGAIGAVAAIGYTIWSSYTAKQEAAEQRVRDVAAALDQQTQAAVRNAQAAAETTGEIDALAAANNALSQAIVTSDDEAAKVNQALGTLGVQADDLTGILIRLGDDPVTALRDLAYGAGFTAESAQRMADVVNGTDDNQIGVFAGRAREVAEALEYLQDQQEDTDLTKVAREFLNAKVASSELNAELVYQAEAQAGASRSSEQAVDVYYAFVDILSKTPDAVDDAAQATIADAEALDAVAEAGREANRVSGATVTLIESVGQRARESAQQAGYFASELERLAGNQISLQAAQDDLLGQFAALDQIVADVAEGVEGASLSLDENTEAGRNNRREFRSAAEGILQYGRAMIETGESVGDTAAEMRAQTETLVAQLQQFGLTEDEARAYLDTLGLTPENINTAVNLYGDQVARERLQAVLDDAENIPTDVATKIQADIDDGSFIDAQIEIAKWVADNSRTITFNVTTKGTTNGVSLKPYTASAYGNYFDSYAVTSVAEDGDPEAVLTLGKPANLRRQLMDPRIRGPILDALGTDAADLGLGGGSGMPRRMVLQIGGREFDAFLRDSASTSKAVAA